MLTVLFCLLIGIGQDAPKPVPAAIRLPEFVTPTPTPKPAPINAVPVLPADKYYIVDSDTELFVRTAPAGLLAIEAQAGPLTFPVKSLVEGGTGKFKTFHGKFIYVVESIGSGRAELFLIPKGVADDKQILQVAIDAGNAPRPPPDPPKPDDLTGLAKSAHEWALAVVSPDKANESVTLAKNFRAVASAQAAGVYADMQAMSNQLRTLNQQAIADGNEPAWRNAFFAPLQTEFNKSVKSLADYGAACTEIARGLDGVK